VLRPFRPKNEFEPTESARPALRVLGNFDLLRMSHQDDFVGAIRVAAIARRVGY
jgi:hypothetical protein